MCTPWQWADKKIQLKEILPTNKKKKIILMEWVSGSFMSVQQWRTLFTTSIVNDQTAFTDVWTRQFF